MFEGQTIEGHLEQGVGANIEDVVEVAAVAEREINQQVVQQHRQQNAVVEPQQILLVARVGDKLLRAGQ